MKIPNQDILELSNEETFLRERCMYGLQVCISNVCKTLESTTLTQEHTMLEKILCGINIQWNL
jgi:hypothetical protein